MIRRGCNEITINVFLKLGRNLLNMNKLFYFLATQSFILLLIAFCFTMVLRKAVTYHIRFKDFHFLDQTSKYKYGCFNKAFVALKIGMLKYFLEEVPRGYLHKFFHLEQGNKAKSQILFKKTLFYTYYLGLSSTDFIKKKQ